ncbi:glycerate kinase [Arthrobacter sp. R4]|uniref:glycerate kinase n=1 Tax=Arthrobacter sp. R4 TaxID=644417 RepID=UPI003EDA0CCF
MTNEPSTGETNLRQKREASHKGVARLLTLYFRWRRARTVLVLGGSASTDGGRAVSALGFRFLDASGLPVEGTGRNLGAISFVTGSLLPVPVALELVDETGSSA